MFCPNCGEQIADQSKFCPKCGAQITGQDANASASAASVASATPAQTPTPAPTAPVTAVAPSKPMPAGQSQKAPKPLMIAAIVVGAIEVLLAVISIQTAGEFFAGKYSNLSFAAPGIATVSLSLAASAGVGIAAAFKKLPMYCSFIGLGIFIVSLIAYMVGAATLGATVGDSASAALFGGFTTNLKEFALIIAQTVITFLETKQK